jgi:hypothetical protein
LNASPRRSFDAIGPADKDNIMSTDGQEQADRPDGVRAAAERVLKLASELEAHGDVSDLEWARAILHRWIDEATGVVVTPAFGRVTIIHGDGRPSTIQSPELPYRMSRPVGPARD